MRLACHRHRKVIRLVNKTLGSQAMTEASRKEKENTAMIDRSNAAGRCCRMCWWCGACGINACVGAALWRRRRRGRRRGGGCEQCNISREPGCPQKQPERLALPRANCRKEWIKCGTCFVSGSLVGTQMTTASLHPAGYYNNVQEWAPRIASKQKHKGRQQRRKLAFD